MKVFSNALLDRLSQDANSASRARMNLNLHEHFEDPCQRLFNAIGLNSYIQPHRHLLDPKIETLIALRGMFALITFDNEGKVMDIVKFGSEKHLEIDGVGVEVPSNVWHTVVALIDGSLLFEVKEGPFDPTRAKEFALWAPIEGSSDVSAYLSKLRSRVL